VTPEVEVFADRDRLFSRAAQIVLSAAAAGPVALSGGSTPLPVYAMVAAAGVSGSWYQVDERYVPYGHPDCNASMISDAGFGGLHRIRTELDIEQAAASYGRECRTAWAGAPFALALLGLGEDGHTASLFPASPELDEDHHWVVATRDAHGGHRRITMTLPLLNQIERRVFLAVGAGKAEAVRRVVSGAEALPASMIRDPLWLLDSEAAAALP
jgi:6-phosphogluconolactonase